jgi:hypothetical protein
MRAVALYATRGRIHGPEWTTETRYFPADDGHADSHAELYVLVAPNPLTGEAFDNVPAHKRRLGELRTYPNRTSHLINMLTI